MVLDWGKAWLVVAGTEGCGVCSSEGLLNFILGISKNDMEYSISGKGVVVIEVVVISCLSVYVEALYFVKVYAFFLEV